MNEELIQDVYEEMQGSGLESGATSIQPTHGGLSVDGEGTDEETIMSLLEEVQEEEGETATQATPSEEDVAEEIDNYDQRAAENISMNAAGYTDTGTPIGMNPAMAPPRGYVERENRHYDARISVEEAENKVTEVERRLRQKRAEKMALEVNASSTATALGSAMLNIGVSNPDPKLAQKLVGREDKQLQKELSEVNREIEALEQEAEPYRMELRESKNAMYGQIFSDESGKMLSAADAARKVRESKESLNKEISNLEKKRDEALKKYQSIPLNERMEHSNRVAFRNEFKEINEAIDVLEEMHDRLDPMYADAYTNVEYGTPGSADWSGEIEQVGLLEDPIFSLALIRPGIILGNSFGREAAAAVTFGGTEVAAMAGKLATGTAKLGWKGLKGTGKLGIKGIKEINPTNMRAAASLLGRGTVKAATKMPNVVKMSGKAIKDSPATLRKYMNVVKDDVHTIAGRTRREAELYSELAQRHPRLVEQQLLEEAGKVASGDIDPNRIAMTYKHLLRGDRPGKSATEFLVGEKAAGKLRTGKLMAKHVFVDRSAAMKEILKDAGEAGRDAIRRFELQAGSPTYTKLKERNAIKHVNEGLDREEERLLNKMIFARSELAAEDYLITRSQWDKPTLENMKKNLDEIGSQVKHPFGYKRADLERVFDDIEELLLKKYGEDGRAKLDKIKDRADRFFEVSRSVLDDLYSEGKAGENILSKKQYESLVKHRGDYAPRLLAELTGETSYTGMGGRPLSVIGPGWNKMFGTDRVVMMDNRRFLSHMIGNSTERVIRAKTNRKLYEAAQEINAMEEASGQAPRFVRILKKRPQSHLSPTGQKRLERLVDEGDMTEETFAEIMENLWTSKFEKLGKDEVFIGTMIDGEQIGMGLNRAFAEQWMKGDPSIAHNTLNALNWIMLTRPLKMAATMYNPAFAIRNIARDMQHAYMATSGLYSSFLPVGYMQMADDYRKTFLDAWRWDKGKSKKYMEAVKDGLGMDFLAGTSSWKAHGFENQTLETIANVFGYVGESSEIWTRLAVRERGLKTYLKQGMSYEDASLRATYEARSMLDFSQHGSMMHVLDALFPYANAAMQAGRTMFRAGSTNTAEFAWKAAQVMGAHGILYHYLRTDHPELYNSLSDYERDNYMIIPASFLPPIKEDGVTRHPYFRIATDQQMGPIKAMGEILDDVAFGREFDPMKLVNAGKGMLAINPDVSSLPPLFRIMAEYGANYDFWRQQDIWKGQDVGPENEINKYTSPLAVDVGKATGMSPVRLEHAAGSITANNAWIGMLGIGAYHMRNHMKPEDQKKARDLMLNDIPGLRDVIRYSNPRARMRDNYKQIRQESNLYYHNWRRDIREAIDEATTPGAGYAKVARRIRSANLPLDERRRLMEMARDQMSLKRSGYDTPEWRDIRMAQTSLERARLIYENYQSKTSESDKREYLRNAQRAKVLKGKTRDIFYRIKRNKGALPDGYDVE